VTTREKEFRRKILEGEHQKLPGMSDQEWSERLDLVVEIEELKRKAEELDDEAWLFMKKLK
jgi:hypothetical protein